jgi:AraC family ethanolamine operon transcriptional activator
MRHNVFHDFDAFAESIRDVDSRMMLVNPKRHIWTSSSVNLDGIDLQFGQLGSGNLVQAEVRQGGYLFYLPLTAGTEYSANGTVLPIESFAVVDPGSEICISTKAEHDWCAAFVPTEILAQHNVVFPSSLERTTCRVTRPNGHFANRFRSIVSQIMNTAGNCADFESTAAAEVAATELLKVAMLALGQRASDERSCGGRPKIARQQIIRSCMEFFEQSNANPIAVSDLAAAAGVSERTVRTAFKEYFGIGPIRYVITRQLHQVYRTLAQAEPDGTTVSRILLDHGVWEFGLFASRYRKLFGQLPSQTLRTKRR